MIYTFQKASNAFCCSHGRAFLNEHLLLDFNENANVQTLLLITW